MNKTFVRLAVLIAAAVVAGCAPLPVRGTVVSREGDGEIRVSLGRFQVKVGDKVVLLKTTCGSTSSGKASATTCGNERVGEGVVTRILDERASLVKTDAGAALDAGVVVEKE
jgi:hypothetical protein